MINLTRIAAALLVLLAVALGLYAWTLGRKPAPAPVAATTAAQTAAASPTHAVLVTVKPIPAGEPITAEALVVAQLPIAPAGALRQVDAAVGRAPVIDLGEGTPVLENQLVSGLALRVQPGERAVAVRADESMGVGNRVRPGDLVDVFFVLKSDDKEIERSQARLLLSRKRVLAFGNASLDQLPPSAGQPGAATGAAAQTRNDPARTAVLAVPVEDVNRLVLGEASGRLLLALRNPTDTEEPDPAVFADLPPALQPRTVAAGRGDAALRGVDRAQAGLATTDLAKGGGSVRAAPRPAPVAQMPAAPRPVALMPAGTEVEVLRGDRRETLRY